MDPYKKILFALIVCLTLYVLHCKPVRRYDSGDWYMGHEKLASILHVDAIALYSTEIAEFCIKILGR